MSIRFKNAKELQKILNGLEAQGLDLSNVEVSKEYTYYVEGEYYEYEKEESADSVVLSTDYNSGKLTKITIS